MKNTTSFLIFLFLIYSCKVTDSKEILYHPIVLKAKETSLYTAQIDWKEVNLEFVKLSQNKTGVEALKPALQYLINSLGDKHAAFRSPKDGSIIVSYRGKVEPSKSKERNGDFIDKVINDISSKFSFQLLDNQVGYLKVVAIGSGDVKAQSDLIRQGLIQLKEKEVDKWIVDLRYNGGGNMEPMISGLAPLIGKGSIGGACNMKDEITNVYSIEKGQFNNYGRIACPMDDYPSIPSTEKLALLLSRYTVSSGEMLAITFKGRDNTIFIGEKTGGYTTGNGYDVIDDDLALVISQSIFMDRNKVKYEKFVDVDIEIPFQHNLTIKEDQQIAKAIEWLKQ